MRLFTGVEFCLPVHVTKNYIDSPLCYTHFLLVELCLKSICSVVNEATGVNIHLGSYKFDFKRGYFPEVGLEF